MEDALGLPFEHPAEHLREYLAVLAPLLAGAPVAFHGDHYRVEAAVDIEGAAPVPLLVAAMGPLVLRLAGRLTDGTITSWVGPRTLAGHIVPTIQRAARGGRAGRRHGSPSGCPITLTDDADGARAQMAAQTAWYSTLPSYRAMFEREGVAGPADVALIGDEAALDAGLDRLARRRRDRLPGPDHVERTGLGRPDVRVPRRPVPQVAARTSGAGRPGTVGRAGRPAVRSVRRAVGGPPRRRRARRGGGLRRRLALRPPRRVGAPCPARPRVLDRAQRARGGGAAARDRLARAQRRQPGRRHARRDGGDAAGGQRGPAAARNRRRRRRRDAVRRRAVGARATGPRRRRAAGGGRVDDRHVAPGVVGHGRGRRRVPATVAAPAGDRRRVRPEDGRARRPPRRRHQRARRGRRFPACSTSPGTPTPPPVATRTRSSSRRRAPRPTTASPASACTA